MCNHDGGMRKEEEMSQQSQVNRNICKEVTVRVMVADKRIKEGTTAGKLKGTVWNFQYPQRISDSNMGEGEEEELLETRGEVWVCGMIKCVLKKKKMSVYHS
jgi:hypothetical protein